MNDLPEEFARFPAHWKVLPFIDAVKDATSGNKKLPKQKYSEEGIYPIVDQGQAQFGGYTDEESLLCKSSNPTIVFGDHTRAFKYVTVPFVLGADGAKVLEPKIENLDKRFLFHYLKQLNIESAGYSRHFKFLKETFVPVPPLDEQKNIAAILDKADDIRQKRKQAIDLADEFLRSVFLEMFGDPVTNPKGWEVTTCGETFKLSSGKGLTAKNMDKDGNYLVYGGNGINGKHSEYMFEEPQLIIGRVGVYCGSIHITEKKSWVTDNAMYIKEYLKKVNIIFLAQLLDLANLNQYAGKAAQPLISGNRIYPLEIIFPPIEEQERFAKIHKVFIESMAKLHGGLESKSDLFQSLSQKAFSGQL
ncbi:restriction endonuclease subunit S [Vibrio parahaemolyticus]|uniref:restriction endonuclease subunit S n=1 Tax=Vibrio vulnificus TaxID=672 RepID=UPI001A282A82|nr:restriction endonuclease subunit S [Vibrio vulnificus]MDF5326441.1 restriction endonuclease subunit S [Vibrio parahaemolyticus]ELV8588855.1 restriction endonuclease subunit S [Vibrio vulnificus]MCG6292385.1 restriction endonuclease subunit S [Vibrio vulnificus]MCU8296304.1 restriction endonuclease subunit S [Vibrio vulnificus]HAS8193077.1 restriction endonuclease subunit S [Vibrio vulnificus]